MIILGLCTWPIYPNNGTRVVCQDFQAHDKLLKKIISVLLIKPTARRIRVHSSCGYIILRGLHFAPACKAGYVKIIWAD
jgi:hypothetical protein